MKKLILTAMSVILILMLVASCGIFEPLAVPEWAWGSYKTEGGISVYISPTQICLEGYDIIRLRDDFSQHEYEEDDHKSYVVTTWYGGHIHRTVVVSKYDDELVLLISRNGDHDFYFCPL